MLGAIALAFLVVLAVEPPPDYGWPLAVTAAYLQGGGPLFC